MTKPNNGLATLPGLPDAPSEPGISKSAFAERVGVSKGRVSQMVEQGLPVLPNGRIDPEAGEAWMDANLDPAKRKRTGHGGPKAPPSVRNLVEQERLELLRMEKAKKAGQLIDRAAVEATIFKRARLERDGWLAWAVRTAPILAGRFGIDERDAFAELDRLVRAQLAELAETPLETGDAG